MVRLPTPPTSIRMPWLAVPFFYQEQCDASAVGICKCVGSGMGTYMSPRPSRRPQPSRCPRGWGLNPSGPGWVHDIKHDEYRLISMTNIG
jgi:hypothetical protein